MSIFNLIILKAQLVDLQQLFRQYPFRLLFFHNIVQQKALVHNQDDLNKDNSLFFFIILVLFFSIYVSEHPILSISLIIITWCPLLVLQVFYFGRNTSQRMSFLSILLLMFYYLARLLPICRSWISALLFSFLFY